MRHLLVLLGLLPTTLLASPSIEVGSPFPTLQFPKAGNEAELGSLEDFRGRKLMLHLFASW